MNLSREEVQQIIDALDSKYIVNSGAWVWQRGVAITLLQSRLAEGEQELWQPIETAPCGSGEDGPGSCTHIDYVEPPKLLLFTSEGIEIGYYDWYYHEGYGRGAEPGVSAWRTSGSEAYNPTHWMPLPAAPQGEPK